MFKSTTSYTFLLLWVMILSSCDEPATFSKEYPFAVIAKKYRDPLEAVTAKELLEEKGIEPYLMYYDTENEGRWHGIFLGAFPTLETMMKGKIDYEDQLRSQEIERINFHQIQGNVIAFDYDALEDLPPSNTTIDHVAPDLLAILQQLPYQEQNRLVNVHAIQQMDGTAARTQAVTRYNFDFPRGIKPAAIYQNTSTLLEARYQHNFTGQHFSIQVIKLLKKHSLGEQIAQKFSDRILATREYDYEESENFTVGNLKGMIVNIAPSHGRILHYMILTDPEQKYLYFLQSREKFFPLTHLKEMSKLINQEKNATHLPKIHQALSFIPNNPNDSLVSFAYQRVMPNNKGISNRWTGNDEATYFFYKEEIGFWKTELTHLPDLSNAQKLYEVAIKNRKFRSKQDSISIEGHKAVVLSIRRKKKKGRGSAMHPEELRFKRKQVLGIISNRNKAWLDKEQLEEKAKAFVIP